MRHSVVYTFIFAAIICVVCGILVSSAAVSLKDQQKFNAELDKKKNVLQAAGLLAAGESADATRVDALFANVESVAVDMRSDSEDPDFELTGYDQFKASQDPERSYPAPENISAIKRVPNHTQIYKVRNEAGELEQLVVPIEGLGLWGTLYGFLSIDSDLSTVRGITFYQHKETPGLGGEVDNPRWKAKWPGRKVYGQDLESVRLEVIKGEAPPAEEDPYRVDGLSGATITARGVSNMIDFWLGDRGFGPYIQSLRQRTAA